MAKSLLLIYLLACDLFLIDHDVEIIGNNSGNEQKYNCNLRILVDPARIP